MLEVEAIGADGRGRAPAPPEHGHAAPIDTRGYPRRRRDAIGHPIYRARRPAPGHPDRRPGHRQRGVGHHDDRTRLAGRIDALGNLILERVVEAARETALGTEADPVMLEVFNNLFMNIAEQMGATLQNTAYSVNIKERLDFSCALFDAEGNLVANAPHVPVHLGSMSDAVRTVARLNAGTSPRATPSC
jgi:5-oxoprolinase (ATP-hydrolysing)